MKRLILIIFLSLLPVLISSAQETHYYQLTSILINGVKKSPNTSSGIFVTFTKDICYDSDKDGFSAGKGKLKRVAEGEQSIKYQGNCHFGNAEYVVSKSRDLINVWSSDGAVYIYTKSNPEPSTKKSYYGSIVCDYGYGNPPNMIMINPNNTQTVNNPPVIIVDNSSRSGNSNSSNDLTCPVCHGSGKCSYCAGRGWTRSGSTIHDCIVCKGTGRCISCYGKGRIRD